MAPLVRRDLRIYAGFLRERGVRFSQNLERRPLQAKLREPWSESAWPQIAHVQRRRQILRGEDKRFRRSGTAERFPDPKQIPRSIGHARLAGFSVLGRVELALLHALADLNRALLEGSPAESEDLSWSKAFVNGQARHEPLLHV